LIDIRPIAAAAPDAVEALLDAAFGTDRHGRTAYRLRVGTQAIPHLSFAAFDDELLVGTLQSWPVVLTSDGSQMHPLVMVGPVAVLPDRQMQGIGRALMDRMVETADAEGDDALMLIGDPEYYDRLFGFNAEQTSGWEVPGPVERHRLLARLRSDRLNGRQGMLGPNSSDPKALR
jgi:predicted N-acetyltransferase YhbS